MTQLDLDSALHLHEWSLAYGAEMFSFVMGGANQAAEFMHRNPEDYAHMVRVASMIGEILTAKSFDSNTIRLGVGMGAGHDWGKDGLPSSDDGVWTLEYIEWFRCEHTKVGGEKVRENKDRLSKFPGMFTALLLATENHHTKLPVKYHELEPEKARNYGLLHLLQAADRWDAFLSRGYARLTGSGLTPLEAMGTWVLNGRPHPLPPVVVLQGRHIDLQEHLMNFVKPGIRA